MDTPPKAGTNEILVRTVVALWALHLCFEHLPIPALLLSAVVVLIAVNR